MGRRRALGGFAPQRVVRPRPLSLPSEPAYQELLAGTGEKVGSSTTGEFTRLLRNLLRDPELGRRVVPIIPDKARTFGIDGLFREVRIYSPGGLRYKPVDAGLLLSCQEAPDGQILEEGITEAGSMAHLLAAGTAYASSSEPMVPFFVYCSMFGPQRFADLPWAAGDVRARGFPLAATAGRTTLQGEGLQHCDGHSLLFMGAIPTVRAYDPAFTYEVAVVVRDGLQRLYGDDPQDLLYYLTLYRAATRPIRSPRYLPASKKGSSQGSIATERHLRVAPTGRGSSQAEPPCSPTRSWPSAPTGTASRTRERRIAVTSRSTRRTSWLPPCRASGGGGAEGGGRPRRDR